jgi:fructokinase
MDWMRYMYDVVAIGELLIDLIPHGLSKPGNLIFEGHPGGAPANVMVALGKLGKKTAFIGKVGNDQFGIELKNTLRINQVDSKGLIFADDVPTTLSCVHLDHQGDRKFSFYRNPGADMTLKTDEVDLQMIVNSRILHFGSISMTHEPARSATIKAVMHAKKNGLLISYDPNLREKLWNNLDCAREQIKNGLKYADIVKLSEEELVFLAGERELESAIHSLLGEYQISLLFTTLGEKGCLYSLGNKTEYFPSFNVKAVDTTGAGDAFLAAILYKILEFDCDLTKLNLEDVRNSVEFACASGAITTMQRGAIPSMPLIHEIENFISMKRGEYQ